MSIKTVFSVFSGLVFIYAFFPYIKAIVRRKASPRKATWMVWAAGDIIVLFGMLAKHTTSGMIIAGSVGATIVFLLSLKYGEAGWTKCDKICIALSGIAITLWIYFGESNIGIALGLTSLFIAAWPTYLSAWNNPANEDKKTWVAFNVSSLLSVIAIPAMTFADVMPPVVFLVIDAPMLFLLFIHPRFQVWVGKILSALLKAEGAQE